MSTFALIELEKGKVWIGKRINDHQIALYTDGLDPMVAVRRLMAMIMLDAEGKTLPVKRIIELPKLEQEG